MKNTVILFLLAPLFLFANTTKTPSKIKEVTVYLNGAQITRTASCLLQEGSNEVVFTGLSHKIDGSSIQISGLGAVSILSIAYNINYLEKSESNPKIKEWENRIEELEHEISLLKNTIAGLEEEEKVINSNRNVNGEGQMLDLERIKQISAYYRERITKIKNEIFKTNLNINKIKLEINDLQQQLAEANNASETPQGEITITFDAPISTNLNATLSYLVKDAGWVPNYDIKSNGLNAPLSMAYKGNVYQNTGQDWKDVKISLSTGNPNYNISKPTVEAHYLNFVSAYHKRKVTTTAKKGYAFNPNVKKVVGTVTDESGAPLPGVSILVKGTSIGTTSDFDGNYSLDVPSGKELVYSYIGMHMQELPIYSSIMNVRMEEDAQHLDEVVVTGYSTASVERTLSGRVAGVSIRGASNVSNNPQPLYIIDGIPVDGFVDGDLDENEIQDIEVLKGSNASAIYGTRGANGVVVITTKKSQMHEGATKTEFAIKKPYTIMANGDITAIEVNTFKIPAAYEYFAAPVLNENVYLTASFKDWEKHQLLPGEANIYFEGAYAGKTVIDPYTTKKEMILSLGIEPNITVTRQQERNFKSRPFVGSNRILDRSYVLEVKNNKNTSINLKLMDRIPKSQNKEIKVDDIITHNATYDESKGLLTWNMAMEPKSVQKTNFSFQVKFPKERHISL
ncbi:mucoidy inhibitor MuiA family protein [Muricauda sp. 334s03]|uniref:Mucoidy inhibitor MuiA family protein n=1 Tax=Flagellimonas yonaguniensis TaxID=3031325 RepID=A0ABT5Y1S2_9FLAO|nr:mucoidy inhibitor MuiA family protein [[Muricauda] yonaguniensis]MDF0717393.1 mucoidy inhibitor MuiA family protein [[Muricauda] yonaguniensis]